MNRLDGKVALITGGARGMGAEEARLFATAGGHVVVTDLDAEAGVEVAKAIGPRCHFFEHDVTSQAGWTQTVGVIEDRFGRLDILVNNAGIFRVMGLEETPLEVWDQLIAVNQTGIFLGMQAALPLMKRQRAGSIINLSSIAGLAGTPRAPAYAATKWAVRGLTKSAALEFARFGIRVNSVHPGLVDTRMMEELSETSQELDARVPLGRQATPTEIAKLVLFLASDDSSHCSGHEFVADGAIKA